MRKAVKVNQKILKGVVKMFFFRKKGYEKECKKLRKIQQVAIKVQISKSRSMVFSNYSA